MNIQERNERDIRGFMRSREAQRYRASTIRLHSKILRKAAVHVEERHSKILLRATTMMLKRYLDSGVSVTTRRVYLSVLKGFFEFYGKKRGFNDFKMIVRESDRNPISAPMPRSVLDIYDMDINPIHKLFFAVLVETGVRVAKAVSLIHDDFRSDIRLLMVNNAKGGRNRTIGISARLMHLYVTAFRDLQPKTGPIFGFSENQGYKIIKNLGDDIGIKLAPHALRKYFACKLYHETKDIVRVQKALGHSNISTTSNYLTRDYEVYCAAVENLPAIYDKDAVA